MKQTKLKIYLIILAITLLFSSCETSSRIQKFPPVMLWAWERNEDLRFIDSKETGVAYLAQTLNITKDKVVLIPRQQPLKVNSDTFLIAVTRIETNRPLSAFSESQLNEVVYLITRSALRPDVRGIQIDFDVKVSEREFYTRVLKLIRKKIPEDKTISITALASFCIGDKWLTDLPVDEAVPMLFEMGPDSRQIIKHLKNGKDMSEPLCRKSYGLAIYEPQKINFEKKRIRYYFNSRSWKPIDLEKLK
jgi:hypothetical protein